MGWGLRGGFEMGSGVGVKRWFSDAYPMMFLPSYPILR